MNLTGQTIWVTGASSGIGLALVHALVAEGARVLATARNADALQALVNQYPQQVTALPADLTSVTAMPKLGAALAAQPLNGILLNAGTCLYMDVQDFRADIVAQVLEVNLTAQARCLELALPRLRATQAAGKLAWIAGVSSSAHWFPFPRAEAYGASKAGFTYLLKALRADLAAEGIPVTLIEPGFVETPLTDRNDFDMPFRVSAGEAATCIVSGLQRGRRHIHFPRRFTVLLAALSALPNRCIDALAARLSRNDAAKSLPTTRR